VALLLSCTVFKVPIARFQLFASASKKYAFAQGSKKIRPGVRI